MLISVLGVCLYVSMGRLTHCTLVMPVSIAFEEEQVD